MEARKTIAALKPEALPGCSPIAQASAGGARSSGEEIFGARDRLVTFSSLPSSSIARLCIVSDTEVTRVALHDVDVHADVGRRRRVRGRRVEEAQVANGMP